MSGRRGPNRPTNPWTFIPYSGLSWRGKLRRALDFISDLAAFVRDEWPALLAAIIPISIWIGGFYIGAHFIIKYW